ncbi:MAG: ABC transporter ATP-binding protein [Variovorax sp.]|nr:MAG: ABC transporter ATP-binding protein [Variovorax sp.]
MASPEASARPGCGLQVSGLTVSFGGLRAVDDLSFTVAPGTIKGIIGPNGAGKTTLFNAVAGVEAPSSGRVTLDDIDMTTLRPHRRAALGLSRTFQNLQLFREMSVLENVMVGAHPKMSAGWLSGMFALGGAEERAAEDEALRLLALLGLDARAGDLAADLGFADAKLLEIARAMASRPRLLLLDEPIAGVPLAEQNRILEVIRAINADGVTIVLVEHNMRVVMSACADILVMNYGKRLAEGNPAEVARNPEVIRAYLGGEAAHA